MERLKNWQLRCMSLLHMRYPTGDVIEIPDRDKGDLGLEAFTRDGCGYQCYAAEEPLSVDDLYRKHRDKIATDVAKQEGNSSKFVRMLGSLRLSRWIFMVPRHESRRLLAYAETKSQEFRDKNLPQLADNFAITIVTELNYPEECNRLAQSAIQGIDIAFHATIADVEHLQENEPELIQTMRNKLRQLPTLANDPQRLQSALHALMKQYLKYINVSAVLRDTYPDISARLDRVIVGAEDRLAIDHSPLDTVGFKGIPAVARELAQRVRDNLAALSIETADDVAYGVAADWLMRCPLSVNGSDDQ